MVEKFEVYLRQGIADKMHRMAIPFGCRTDRLIALLCEGLFENPGYAPEERITDHAQEQNTETRTSNNATPIGRTNVGPHCRV